MFLNDVDDVAEVDHVRFLPHRVGLEGWVPPATGKTFTRKKFQILASTTAIVKKRHVLGKQAVAKQALHRPRKISATDRRLVPLNGRLLHLSPSGLFGRYSFPRLRIRPIAYRCHCLGKLLFADRGIDPYLEDPATLWILHWQIASNRSRATTWYWAFNFFHEPEFTRDALTSSLHKWTQTLGGKQVAASSLKRDVDCFLRTYVASRHSRSEFTEDSLDCPLIELGLVTQSADSQMFRFRRGAQQGLPDGILLYAALQFWDLFSPQSETLALSDLARSPGSPGRLFKIDESSLAGRLERVESLTDGALSYGETAGLRQLYRRKPLEPSELLSEAYAVGGQRR